MNIFDPHITGSLSVSASAHIEGDLTVLGTIRGDAQITGEVDSAISASHAASYLLTSSFEGVSGSFAITGSNNFKGDQTISGSLLPEGTLVHDIGSESQRWNDIYLAGSTIDIGGTKISKNDDGDVQFHDSGNTLKKIIASEIQIGHGNNRKTLKVSNGRFKLTGLEEVEEGLANLSGSFTGSFVGDGSQLTNVPASGVTGLSLDSISSGSNSLTMGETVLVSNVSILPNITDTIDLGSPTKQWRDLFLSSGSLYINGQQVLSTTGDELRITTDTGESIKIIETSTDTITLQTEDGDITLTASGNGNIELDAPIQIGAGNKILSSDGNEIQFGNGLSVTGSVVLTGTVDGVDIAGLNTTFNSFTSSTNGAINVESLRINSLEGFTASIDDTYASDTDVTTLRTDLNTYTSSNDTTNTNQDDRLDSLETKTGSLDTTNTTQNGRLDSVENFTSSVDGQVRSDFNTYTASNDSNISTLNTHKTTVEGGLEFTGSNVTIKGNLLVKGTETRVNSTTVDLDDNIISLNGTGASDAGIEVRDVTSPGILSGSLLWDGVTNYWKGGTKGNEERLLDSSDLTTLDGRLDSIETTTSSFDGRLDSLEITTGSLKSQVSSLEGFTASIDDTYASDSDVTTLRTDLNTYTSSNDTNINTLDGRLDSLETESGSVKGRLEHIEIATGSLSIDITTLDGRLGSVETKTGSLSSDISTLDGRVDTIESQTGSYQDGYDYSQVGHLPLSGGTMTGDIHMASGEGITFYGNGSGDHGIFGRNSSGNVSDDIRINSYHNVHINLDSNNNNTTSTTFFTIGQHGSTGALGNVFTVDGVGNVVTSGTLSASGYNDGNWNTAYGWGDHSTEGYIKSFTNTNEFVSGVTFNSTNGVVTFTRNNGGDTFTVDIDGRYSLLNHVHTFASLTSKPTTLSGYGITDAATSTQGSNADTAFGWGNHASVGYITSFTNTNEFVSGATFNSGDGVITFTRNNGGDTFTVDIDGRYLTSIPNSLISTPQLISGTSGVYFYNHYSGNQPTDAPSGGRGAGVQFGGSAYSAGLHVGGGLHFRSANGEDISVASWVRAWSDGDFTSTNISNWNTAYGWGNHASVGYLTTHPTIAASASSNNGGRTYIQDILLDGFGHITGITTATETVVNTDTNYFVTGHTWNSTTGVLTTTLNDGSTTNVNLVNTLSDVTVTGGTYTSGTQILTLTKNDGSTVDVSGFAIDTDVNWYTTGSTFNSTNGVITFTRSDGGTYTVDIDGKYSLLNHVHTFASLTSKPTTLSGYGITDGISTPSGLGPVITGDLDTQTETGFYRGTGLTNAPDNGWFYIIVEGHDNNSNAGNGWVKQSVTAYGAGNNAGNIGKTFTRIKRGSQTWDSWNEIYSPLSFTNNSSNWNTAFGWGNHASAGYITGYSEVDTLDTVSDRGATTNNALTIGPNATGGGRILSQNYSGSNRLGVVSSQNSSGNLVIGYGAEGKSGSSGFVSTFENFSGRHSALVFSSNALNWYVDASSSQTTIGSDLTLNNKFSVSDGGVLTMGDGFTSTKGNTAYGWGNHSTEGYIKSFTNTNEFVTGATFNSSNGIVTFTRNNGGDTFNVDIDGRFSLSAHNHDGDYIQDGGSSAIGDINTIGTESIKHRWNTSTVGRPALSQTNEYGTVTTLTYDSLWATQIAWDIHDSNLYGRTLDVTNNTGTWSKFFTDSNFTDNSTNWNTAYGWGDHSTEGYIKSFTNTNEFTTGATFNNGNGIVTFTRNNGGDTFTVDLDGRYLQFDNNGAATDVNDVTRTIFSVNNTNGTTTNRNANYTTVYTLGGGANALQLGTNPDYDESGLWVRQYNQNAASPQGTGWQNWTELWTTEHFSANDRNNWNTAYGWGNHASVGYLTTFSESDTLHTVLGRNNVSTRSMTIGSTLNVTADGGSNYTASRIYLNSHNDARGLGVFMSGVGSTWYAGTPYGNHAGSYIISRKGTVSDEATANPTHALFTLTNTGNLSVDGTLTASGYNDGNWNTSYGWGNHASAGYLTSITGPISGDWWNGGFISVGTDGVMEVGKYLDFHTSDSGGNNDFDLRVTAGVGSLTVGGTIAATGGNSTQWNTSYGWGNHASGGYASNTNVSNWDTAYGWGNHASAGYLTSFTETNSFLGDGGGANTHPGTNRVIFTGQVSAGSGALGMPTVDNSNAFLNINRHSGEYNSQLGFSSNGHIYYRKFSAAAINGTQPWLQVYHSGVFTNNSSNWNTAYGWGNHASAGYISSFTDTNEFVTGATFNGSNGIVTFTRNNGGDTFELNLASTLTDVTVTGGTYTSGTQTLRLTKSDGNTIDVSGFAIDTDTNTNNYTTGATFNTGNGIITGTLNGGGTWTVDIDGKYSELSHNHDDRYFQDNKGSISLTGSNPFDDSKTETRVTGSGSYVINYTGASAHLFSSNVGGSASMFQIGAHYNGSDFYMRTRTDSSTWQTWKQLWHSGDFSSTDISQWNTAYGWGDHASAGYITSPNGGNATTLDGIDSTQFLRSDVSDTHTATLTVNGQFIFNSSLNSSYREGIRLNVSTTGWGAAVIGGQRNSISGITDGWWVARNPSKDFVISYGTSANSGGLYLPYNSSALEYKNNRIWNESDFANNSGNWNTAYGWGNHASGGYATLSGSNSFTNSYNEFGNGTGSVSNDGSWNARVNVAGSQHARLDVKSVSDGIITTMFSHIGHAAGKVGTYSNHPLKLVINGIDKATLDSGGGFTLVGGLTSTTVNTGQGATEVHLMNQNVRTTDSPTFSTLNATSLVATSTVSGSTVLDIQGTQGQLFSITDDLTGDLFSVSDSSGVPIFNVNANGTVSIDTLGLLTVGGSITGTSFVKSGGTSSEFLKADGSVDSTTYLSSLPSHTHTFASLTSKPTTLSGYGITDGIVFTTGNQTISGTKTFDSNSLVISGTHNTISFMDTTSSEDNFYIHVNSSNFYVLADRDGTNQIDAGYEAPHPLQLEGDTNTAYVFGDELQISNWNTAYGWGDHANTYSLTGHTHTFASLTSKPTTVSGYGITDMGSQSVSSATTATNLGDDYTADDWIRATGDNNPVKFYGGSTQMTFRTDGVTEAYSGIGGYPFVWTYGGSTSTERIMLLSTTGRIWSNEHGWLDDAFATSTQGSNADTAFGWGDHGLSAQDKIDIGNLSGTNTGDQTNISGNAATADYATTAGSAPNASNLNSSYGVSAAEGNGLKFWNGADTYKIAMGNAAEYHYGPVTDYSIKMVMDSVNSTRGFTWGVNGATPIAGLNVGNGNMEIAGTFTASNFSGTSSGTNTGDQTNISGNAATATYATTAGSADLIDGQAFKNTTSNSAQNADTIASNGISYYTSGVTNFSGNSSDGALYSQAYSSAWQHQIAGDFRSGQIAVRGKNSGTWQSWKKVALVNSTTFSSVLGVAFTHGLGTKNLVVQVYDTNDNLFFPSDINVTDTEVNIDFAKPRSGRVVVTG